MSELCWEFSSWHCFRKKSNEEKTANVRLFLIAEREVKGIWKILTL